MARSAKGTAAADMLRKIQDDYLELGEPITEQRLGELVETIERQSLLRLAQAIDIDSGNTVEVDPPLEIAAAETAVRTAKPRPKKPRAE